MVPKYICSPILHPVLIASLPATHPRQDSSIRLTAMARPVFQNLTDRCSCLIRNARYGILSHPSHDFQHIIHTRSIGAVIVCLSSMSLAATSGVPTSNSVPRTNRKHVKSYTSNTTSHVLYYTVFEECSQPSAMPFPALNLLRSESERLPSNADLSSTLLNDLSSANRCTIHRYYRYLETN